LWVALPGHVHPLALICLGCAVYVIVWALIGRRQLRAEFEGLA
jgi:REP element-mobilizing transposase RayT